jgi:hypothetical protein
MVSRPGVVAARGEEEVSRTLRMPLPPAESAGLMMYQNP